MKKTPIFTCQIYLLPPGNCYIFLFLQLTKGLELRGSLLHLVSHIWIILEDSQCSSKSLNSDQFALHSDSRTYSDFVLIKFLLSGRCLVPVPIVHCAALTARELWTESLPAGFWVFFPVLLLSGPLLSCEPGSPEWRKTSGIRPESPAIHYDVNATWDEAPLVTYYALLTSSFFSKLSMRSFFDARLALVYLFWVGRYRTCRKIE